MNVIGFAIRRVARSFGIKSEMNRRMAITRELQLLAEAEGILGRAAWADSENIQEVAEEFYQIRDLVERAKSLRQEIRGVERENTQLLAQQEDLETQLEEKITLLTSGKSTEMQRTITLMNEIEGLKLDAEITRKKYSGMKLRLKSMTESGASDDELDSIRENLLQMKNQYSAEIQQIVDRQKEVQNSEQEITGLEDKVSTLRDDARSKISTLMNQVGKSSNLLARHSAKLGGIEKDISDLTYSVGSFLSTNSLNPNPEIRAVVQKHRSIISRINSMKSSIRYNRILSGQLE